MPHQGIVMSVGSSAWRSTGEYARLSMRMVVVSLLLVISPGVWRNRRWRTSGVTVVYPPPSRVREGGGDGLGEYAEDDVEVDVEVDR